MPSPVLNAAFSQSSDFSPNFEELLQKLDEEFARLPAKMLKRSRFSLEGLNFDISRVAQGDSHRFLVKATIGYMPFSIESDERREAIKTIIIASRALPNVRFGVDASSQISAGALFDVPHIVSPDFIFYPLTLFMQEARPFINLIGEYLSAAAPTRGQSVVADAVKSD
jgi:hypothetical protein